MALLNASSRRFHRNRDYSHQQRRDRIEHVRERIVLAAPRGRSSRTRTPAPQA